MIVNKQIALLIALSGLLLSITTAYDVYATTNEDDEEEGVEGDGSGVGGTQRSTLIPHRQTLFCC
jgi:hypothetical protein